MKNRAATALGVILGVVAALASTASAGTAAAMRPLRRAAAHRRSACPHR